ncbi:MAG: DUF58 domain-containing protein [Gaiellales bacterium]
MIRTRPTGRGLVVLAVAAVAYLAGWVFGTRELAALGVVLTLALPLALLVVSRASRSSSELERRVPARAVAGAPIVVSLTVEPISPLVAATVVERCERLGDPAAPLRRAGGAMRGEWRVAEPARGRYLLAPELVLEDAFGLARARRPLPRTGLVRVEPQLVELAPPRARALRERDGARPALPSASGEGIAGVRDHEVGESLRRVHWRTTARRGRLTVRELEEPPRVELSIVLDAAAQSTGGDTFERAVCAAGSLAMQAARAGASVTFESTDRHATRVDVGSTGSRAALIDALCAVEPDGELPIASLLGRVPGARILLVSSDLGPELVERVRALRARRRSISIVAIEAARSAGFDRAIAELTRAGAELVVVRHGEDLARRLAVLAGGGVAGAA